MLYTSYKSHLFYYDRVIFSWNDADPTMLFLLGFEAATIYQNAPSDALCIPKTVINESTQERFDLYNFDIYDNILTYLSQYSPVDDLDDYIKYDCKGLKLLVNDLTGIDYDRTIPIIFKNDVNKNAVDLTSKMYRITDAQRLKMSIYDLQAQKIKDILEDAVYTNTEVKLIERPYKNDFHSNIISYNKAIDEIHNERRNNYILFKLLDFSAMYSYSLGVLYGCRCLGYDNSYIWRLDPKFWYTGNYKNLVSTAWYTFRFYHTVFLDEFAKDNDAAEKYQHIEINRLWNFDDEVTKNEFSAVPLQFDELPCYIASVEIPEEISDINKAIIESLHSDFTYYSKHRGLAYISDIRLVNTENDKLFTLYGSDIPEHLALDVNYADNPGFHWNFNIAYTYTGDCKIIIDHILDHSGNAVTSSINIYINDTTISDYNIDNPLLTPITCKLGNQTLLIIHGTEFALINVNVNDDEVHIHEIQLSEIGNKKLVSGKLKNSADNENIQGIISIQNSDFIYYYKGKGDYKFYLDDNSSYVITGTSGDQSANINIALSGSNLSDKNIELDMSESTPDYDTSDINLNLTFTTENNTLSYINILKYFTNQDATITLNVSINDDFYKSDTFNIRNQNDYITPPGIYLNITNDGNDRAAFDWKEINTILPSESPEVGFIAQNEQPLIRYIGSTEIKIFKAYCWNTENNYYLSPNNNHKYFIAQGAIGWVDFNEDDWRDQYFIEESGYLNNNKLTISPISFNKLNPDQGLNYIRPCYKITSNTNNIIIEYCYIANINESTNLYCIFDGAVYIANSNSYVFPKSNKFKYIFSKELFDKYYTFTRPS